MIVRLILDGLFSLRRRPVVPTLRLPRPAHAGPGAVPGMSFRGRPDLMLVTGAMSAPPSVPHRAVRGRLSTVRGSGSRWAA